MRDSRNWIIGIAIVIIFALIAFYLYFQQQGQVISFVPVPPSYAGPVNVSAVALEINYMHVTQQCFGNSVQELSGFSSNGMSAQNILITLTDSCGGVHSISSMETDTPGFFVISTNPLVPISLRNGDKLTFNVTLATPKNYSGVVNILVNST